jgi:mannosyltransferase
MMFVLPAWTILAALTLARSRVAAAVAVVALTVVVGLPAHRMWREPGGHGVASRQAAAIISDRYQPGDVVMYGVTGGGQVLALRDLVNHYVPADRRPSEPLLVRAPRTKGRVGPDLCRDVAACLKNPPRVWIVRLGTPQNPVTGLGPGYDAALRNYVVQERWTPKGITIALLTSNRQG